MTLAPDQSILNGKYRILRQIGEGAAARVWLAEEPRFGGRLVAIKELRRDLLTPGELEEQERRFYQEVRLAALLEQAHAPHVVRALTVEELPDGARLLVMAYADGGSLADLLVQHPQGLPIDQAVRIAVQVAEALDALHSLPVEPVHRDVKPSNILLTREGEALLGDFGLAQLAGASGRSLLSGGQHPGTPMTMAPEQERGAGYLTPAADVYALGCVLWEMLIGKRYKRFQPGTPPSQLRSDVPAWLEQVVVKALAEDPWERWSGASEMAVALRKGSLSKKTAQRANEVHATAEASQISTVGRNRRITRSRWAVGALALAMAAVGMMLVITRNTWLNEIVPTATHLTLTQPPAQLTNPNSPDRSSSTSVSPTLPPASPAPLSVATPTSMASTQVGSTYGYVTRPGDTLFSIALMHNTDVETIRRLNNLMVDSIEVGQVLVVPGTGELVAPPEMASTDIIGPQVIHTVGAGENLSSMAALYGVPWQDLAAVNSIPAPYTIYRGQRLVIPDAVVVTQGATLYAGLDTDHYALASYPPGTIVEVLSKNESADWLRVQTPDRRTGWMARAMLRVNVELSQVPVD